MVDSVEEGGFEALQAWSGEAAITLLQGREDVRLILSDIDMPGGMSGLELAGLVRDRWPPIEIILTSAGVPPNTSALPARVVFMPKPLDRERLVATLHEMSRETS